MRMEKIGWVTSLTYCVEGAGLTQKYLENLLEEMVHYEMNTLWIFMASPGYYDPHHNGLCWPVRDIKLKPLVDTHYPNTNESTEFLSKIIKTANSMGIEVHCYFNYGEVLGISEIFDVCQMTDKNGVKLSYSDRICHDCDGSQEYQKRLYQDLLAYYGPGGKAGDGIKGIGQEWPPGYINKDYCYCKCGREKFSKQMGKNMEDATSDEIMNWKDKRVEEALRELVDTVKNVDKNIEFGFCSGYGSETDPIEKHQVAQSNKPEVIKQTGADYTILYGEDNILSPNIMEHNLSYFAPFPVLMWLDCRTRYPEKYQKRIKTPTEIEDFIERLFIYKQKKRHLLGIAFWNEPLTQGKNREAIYKGLRKQSR